MGVSSLSRDNSLVRLFKWIYAGFDRTIFMGLKFTIPTKFVSPLGFLGMLTFVVFIILGITGAFLMLWYEPILDRAWDSVEKINDTIPYGFHMRNIHYHASNAMVMLAILHMYYQFFSGRYKIRNEMLWVTGVLLGVLTILEAFTGYDIIFSERAELAISIAASLTNSIPILGPDMMNAFFGSGFHDFVLRFYAFHVFFLPIVLLGLMVVHFPRFLVFDVPMVMAVAGAIMLTGGVFPIDLGLKFDPNVPPGITVPEWYLTGLYAFLRSAFDKFTTGVAWPGLFIFTLLIMPFIDKYKKFSWKDRPIISALGITSIAQIIVTTYWGFYIDPDRTKSLLERLMIDPIFLYTVMVLLVPLSFGFTYLMIKIAKNAEANAKKQKPSEKNPIQLPAKWLYILFVALIGFQVYLNIAAYYAVLDGMKNYSLFLIGILMLVFAGMFHLYRYGRGLSKSNVEIVTTNKRKFIFPSIGGSKRKSLEDRSTSMDPSKIGPTEDNPLLSSTEKKDIPVPEIGTHKGGKSSPMYSKDTSPTDTRNADIDLPENSVSKTKINKQSQTSNLDQNVRSFPYDKLNDGQKRDDAFVETTRDGDKSTPVR
ncbi:cytochrome b [Candidatus Nitrosocosmicus agrestis]|uniref:cytochrome b n=1 Tax=Candidatus Nitrosocosmicus agrestis TaxID=2563600 RepID=UPI001E604B47|nr:cytochrome b N-terminal domain-containing protein [Candidatus Nitrosocosmicus sp. SS]MDR4491906.1 cytochrome b N-terminal domain-containing protein [Candidatus Nitrosocosmicus sp.]